MPSEQEEFEFRARAEQEAESRRRTPREISRGSILPYKILEGDEKPSSDMWRVMAGPRLALPGMVQSAIQAITAPGRAFQSAQGDYVEPDKGGFNPQEEAGNVALNVIPSMAKGMKLPSLTARSASRLAGEKSMASVMDETIARGRAEGLVVYPPNAAGKTALLLGGKSKMRAAIDDTNQPHYDRMAREESGLGPTEAISRKSLRDARTKLAQPYRDLAKVSPEADKLWKDVQSLRVDSRKAWEAAERPEERAAARAIDDQIAAKEAQIDKIAQLNFKPNQLTDLRLARERLAKNYMVDEANLEGTGHINPDKFRMALQNERYMSGKLETIGRFKNAERFLRGEMKEETDALHLGLGGGAHHVGGGGWYPGIPFAGKMARNYALSDIGQMAAPSYKPGLGVKLGDIASRAGPYGFSVVPQLGLRVPESEREE